MKRNILLIDLRLWLRDFTDVVLNVIYVVYTETIFNTKLNGYFYN